MRDEQRRRARALLTRLEERASALQDGPETKALAQALGELAAVLDLGPEEDLVNCPVCGAPGMRSATLCSTCWSRLTPLPRVG